MWNLAFFQRRRAPLSALAPAPVDSAIFAVRPSLRSCQLGCLTAASHPSWKQPVDRPIRPSPALLVAIAKGHPLPDGEPWNKPYERQTSKDHVPIGTKSGGNQPQQMSGLGFQPRDQPPAIHHPEASQHGPRRHNQIPGTSQERRGRLEEWRHAPHGLSGPWQPCYHRGSFGWKAKHGGGGGQNSQCAQSHQKLQKASAQNRPRAVAQFGPAKFAPPTWAFRFDAGSFGHLDQG